MNPGPSELIWMANLRHAHGKARSCSLLQTSITLCRSTGFGTDSLSSGEAQLRDGSNCPKRLSRTSCGRSTRLGDIRFQVVISPNTTKQVTIPPRPGLLPLYRFDQLLGRKFERDSLLPGAGSNSFFLFFCFDSYLLSLEAAPYVRHYILVHIPCIHAFIFLVPSLQVP